MSQVNERAEVQIASLKLRPRRSRHGSRENAALLLMTAPGLLVLRCWRLRSEKPRSGLLALCTPP